MSFVSLYAFQSINFFNVQLKFNACHSATFKLWAMNLKDIALESILSIHTCKLSNLFAVGHFMDHCIVLLYTLK